MVKKPLAIGIDDYKRMIDKAYYYVDKTLFLKELMDKGDGVKLFTRPRRFGKTLALSMIKTYFEKETDVAGNVIDNSHYFAGMKIAQQEKHYTERMGQYPVIFLSLKSAKQPDYKMAYESLLDEIIKEYERHRYVLLGDSLLEMKKEKYVAIMERRAEPIVYAKSLAFLTECLKQYHGQNAVILIDEYDVPLENAYFRGFYEEMIDFIRSLFESALKTNDCLEFAVITGCLRISKESIFTGLNNLEIISLLNVDYAEYFGFTENEVFEMLDFYGLTDKKDEVKKWYNGYLFGKTEVYNPWSVINYVSTGTADAEAFPKAYWSNTSSNSIIRDMIEGADAGMRKEIEELIAQGTITKPVHEDITYGDIHESQDNLWNFLFFTGYLKKVNEHQEERTTYLKLQIPNEEVLSIYETTIREWFQRKIKMSDVASLYENLLKGDEQKISEFITTQLSGSISYYDNAENFYHGYLIGLLSALDGYDVESNKEHGDGRPDIMLSPYQPGQPVIIIEVKCVNKYAQMEAMCETALAQIEERRYDAGLWEEGYQKIIKYAFCFCRKSCMVKRRVQEREAKRNP